MLRPDVVSQRYWALQQPPKSSGLFAWSTGALLDSAHAAGQKTQTLMPVIDPAGGRLSQLHYIPPSPHTSSSSTAMSPTNGLDASHILESKRVFSAPPAATGNTTPFPRPPKFHSKLDERDYVKHRLARC